MEPITTQMRAKKYWWLILILALVIFWALCIRVVGVGQVGIVTRFGNISRETQSGLIVKFPWPIERLVKMNIQVQKEQQEATAATKDLQTVSTTLALNYHLTSTTADDVFRSIGTDYKNRIIDPILQETVKSVTSQYNADQLIAERPAVEAKSLKELQTKLSQRGVTVDNLSIVNFSFSDAFNAAIEQKQVAGQNAQKAQYELQTAQLKSQAQQVQAQTLTPEYLQLQAIEKWDGKMPNYVGGSAVFNIPLTGNATQ